MSGIGDFIFNLEKEDIFLVLNNDKLNIKAKDGVLTEALIEDIKLRKEDIIQYLKSNKPLGIDDKVEESEFYPTSFAQKQMYAINQFSSIGTTYNLYQAIRYTGKISRNELELYFQEIVNKHEALRTTFHIVDEVLMQKIHTNINFEILEENIQKDELEFRLLNSIIEFDLKMGPLFRLFLFHVSENESVILIDMHHIISDGVSMSIIKDDLIKLVSGKKLEGTQILYKDFCNWQQKKIEVDSFYKEKNFWREQLAGELPELELPYDFNDIQTDNFEGNVYTFHLDYELSKRVNKYCEESRLSQNMFLMACYNILLSKVGDADDLIIGTVTSGRNNPLLSQIVGLFVNILPFRSFPKGDKPLRQFFEETRDTFLQVLEHDSFPVNTLMPELNSQSNHYKHQLFSTVFLYQITDSDKIESDTVTFDNISFSVNTAKNDITVAAFEKNDQIGFRLEYKTKLFTHQTIERFGNYFLNIIKTAIQESDLKIADINLLSFEEQRGVNSILDKLDVSYPDHKTICDLFESQVRRTLDKIAVDFETGQISYNDLDKASNKLSNFLISKGVQRGTIIALILGRDIKAITTILAIIKAGGVYLPIDINSSPERINYILNDSSANIIVSDTKNYNSIFGEQKTALLNTKVQTIVDLDEYERDIQMKSDSPTGVEVLPTDLAYIIYTSGTTGKPKGTLIEHENVVRLLFNDKVLFDFNNTDVWTLFHAFNFDFSVWEMYGALLTGGTLILVAENTVKDTDAFLRLLKDKKVTVLNQTPRAFYSLAEKEIEFKNNDLSIRYIIFGGERLMPKKLKAFKDKYGKTKLINMYGITETTVHVTFKEITPLDIDSNESNIGRMLPTLKGYIVNKDNNLVPQGVVGELLVAGKGIARGYLNNPELTAEKFSTQPFGEKLYHSGDLVKLNSSGDLIYVGRNDKQLKIRGYRVEPKEIEESLLNFDGVTNVIVCLQNTLSDVKEEHSDEQSLCAYFTAKKDISSHSLYNYLKLKLPSYYIPSYFIQMEEIPVTANGKTDFRNLPLPGDSRSNNISDTNDKVKLKIVELFNKLIHTNNFDLDHSFFSIGGDSIKVIRLSAMLEKEFNIKFSISDLYVNDTVNRISQFISSSDEHHNEEYFKAAQDYMSKLKNEISLEIDTTDVQDIYPMSDIEAGMSYHYLRYNDQNVYHDCFGFSMKFSNFKSTLFQKACRMLFEKHDIFRSVFHLDKFHIPLKIVYNKVKLDYVHQDISAHNLDEQQEVISSAIKVDLDNPFQIQDYPLIRFLTYKLNEKSIYLFFSVHHGILDGWSVNSFLVELFNLYNKLCKDVNEVPKPIKSNYKDAVLHEIIEKNKESNQIFWKDYLKDHQRLILEKNDVDKSNEYMPIYKYECDKALLVELKKYSQTNSISLKNILFSAFAYAMGVLHNQKEFTLGVVTNFRPPVEDGDAILGCFLNTVPVKVNLNDCEQSWNDYVLDLNDNLNRIKQFERISLFEISKQVTENASDKNPFFDVLFNYLDFHINDNLETDYNDLFDHQEVQVDKYTNTNTFLDFEVNVTNNELVLIPKYNRQYFSKDKVAKVCTYFVQILNELVRNANDLINTNKVIPSDERHLVQSQFVGIERSVPEFTNILTPFEKSTEQYPDNCAIALENHKISYKELNTSANQLAHVLKTLGEEEDSLFGVMTERSPEMIISVISVIKAGYAYVPIEANQPAERISKIINNSGIRNLIISSTLLLKFKDIFNEVSTICNIICVDDKLPEINKIDIEDKHLIFYEDIRSAPTENHKLKNKHFKTAYVIYTSGTTGIPKGVVVNHGTVINTLDWVNKTYEVNSSDKVLFVNSLAFDLSVYDIFGILWAGGCIRLAEKKENSDPDKLIDILLHSGITIWNSAPASLQRLVSGIENIDSGFEHSDLRLVMLSGDWIPLSLAPVIQHKFSGAKIVSLGGATEASIWSNYFNINEIDSQWKSIPYGKPIQNSKYYILDNNLKLCPIGTVGDLYIGGDCLAVGYLNAPELTNQKFIQNPYAEGEIIYKTGDLARWFNDGNIEFLGRNDSQVKIRGYRIELGEIENQLIGIEDIRHCVVTMYKENGEQNLCAYYISDTIIDIELIKNCLKEKLPDYMVPLYYIKVDAFQMTSNGKLDRKKLPKPGIEALQKKQYIAPESEVEKHLCKVYEDFFNLERISIIDDFYDIGGDSLKAINILSIIQKELKIKIELKDFFEAPTIKELALQIENKMYFSQRPTNTNDSTIYI
ncbi:amino acid adenylation domain-containing protein [Gaetbulibacter jejuensis]|uniref:Carrier domain-containing protein n=1 Tax=Gaetbulibacter jejuensis TaxID=584607 RepID=A0ABN1JI83_9FLAO